MVPEGATKITIRDSILRSLHVQRPKEKEDVVLAAKITNTVFFDQQKPFPKGTVERGEGVSRARADFANPRAGDFRLAKDSPLRGKASDQTDLGCRFPPQMIELLKLARKHSSLLQPPTGSGRRR
jgi:hypothetical protein